MYEFIRALVNIYLVILFRCKVKGSENVPKEGGIIICYNHLSAYDIPFIACKLKRRITFIAKKELFRIPVLRTIMKQCNVLPVSRGTADIRSFKSSVSVLKNGGVLAISPHGTRVMKKDLAMVPIKGGAVMMATAANVPIIPMAIDATYKPFSKVNIMIGKPIYIEKEEDTKLSSAEMSLKAREIMDMIYGMIDENKITQK